MSGSPTEDWPRVRVHPGTGVVDRRGDTLLVVPVAPPSSYERVRDLLELCHRPDPTGDARVHALRALLGMHPSAELPGFAVLLRTGRALRVLRHGPVRVLVDGRAPAQPGEGDRRLAEHVVPDAAWAELTVVAEEDAAKGTAALREGADVLALDLTGGGVPGSGVTLHAVPAGPARQPPAAEESRNAGAATATRTSSTVLRPSVQFRSVLLGECARHAPGRPVRGQRPPLPVAGAAGEGALGPGTSGPEIVVEGVHCAQGHFTDPDQPACLTCGAPPAPDGTRVSRPRPPLGVLVTDGGTIYTVTGDFVIGREPQQAPDVLAGRARPLPLRDTARSTSRIHARLTVRGWKVLLSDDGSANGTFVSRSGAAGPWLPATAEVPVTLAHGDRVRLGRRQLLFDAWREAVLPHVFQ